MDNDNINTNKDWVVDSLRFTAFPESSWIFNSGEDTWWESIVATSPDEVISRPKNAEYHANGIISDTNAVLSLNIHIDRIDWILSPVLNNTPITELPSIGGWDSSVELFSNFIESWIIHHSPVLKRIAFGGVLRKQFSTHLEAYKELDLYLNCVSIDPENSRDFAYSINRPRQSAVMDGLMINRLSKWNAMVFNQFVAKKQPGEPDQLFKEPLIEPIYATQLEIDINTSQKSSIPDSDKVVSLLAELTTIGKEIVEKGDV